MKFIQESQQQANIDNRIIYAQTLGEEDNQQQQQQHQVKQVDQETKNKLKEEVIKRVSNQTIQEITAQLLTDNKVALTQQEKQLRKQQQKIVLLQKGGIITKREYKNFKDLKKEAKERREKQQRQQQELFNDQMHFYDKKGKKHALLQENTLTDDQIITKNINRKVQQAARQFSDNRGQQFYKENYSGGIRIKDGEVNIQKQLKNIKKQQKSKNRKIR